MPTVGRKGFSLTSLGRAYLTAGRFDEAFENCRDALDHTDNLITRRLATRTAAEALTHLGRLDEATPVDRQPARDLDIAGTGRHRRRKDQAGPGRNTNRLLTSSTSVGRRQFDDDGFEVGVHMFAVQRAEALEWTGTDQ